MKSDYRLWKGNVLSALGEVAELAERAGAKSVAHRLKDDRIPRLEEERFHLVVLGEFNHGKTTFVNAMLGEPVLPVGVTPTTAVLHRIRHGAEAAAKVTREDGSEAEVGLADLEGFEVEGGQELANVRHLDVSHPSSFLERGLVLVDTPGVNDLNEARAEITYGYIPRADAVIFLLDAGQILKESERNFIANKLLSEARDKVFFVINKMDLLTDEEQREALAYARTNLGKLVDEPRLFGISAEQALSGEGASGMEEFSSALDSFLQDERGRLLIDNAVEAGVRTAEMLRRGIEIQKQALAMEQGELERRLGALRGDLDASADRLAERTRAMRESVAGVKGVVRADVEGFSRRFAEALPAEIEKSEADDLSKYLGDFIESRFRGFADEQAQSIAKRLEAIAEDTIAFVAEDARARADRLKAALGDDAPRLDLDVDTFAYDVGVVAVGAFGVTIMVLSNVLVGAGMIVAMPVLAYVFRGRTNALIKQRAAEEAPKAVLDAAAKMADAFDERIDDFAGRLEAFVREANEEVTRSIAELVERADGARKEGESAVKTFSSDTGMSMVRLAEVKSRLEALHSGQGS